MDFKDRLRTLRGQESKADFAKKIGINPSTLGNYEQGQSLPNIEVITRLCEECSVSSDWLIFGSSSQEKKPAPATQADRCPIDMVRIPKVKARLSAGTGSLETSGNIEDHYSFRSDWINRKCRPNKCVLMDVAGDSMEPVIKDKDIVLIDQGQQAVIAGNIYAIGIDDEVLVKYVDKEPGCYVFRSANPAFAPIRVDISDESLNVRIIGRALWIGREL